MLKTLQKRVSRTSEELKQQTTAASDKDAEKKKAFNEVMGRLILAYDQDGSSILTNNKQLNLYEVEPRLIWDYLAQSKQQSCTVVTPVDYNTPRPPNHVRFVCISDTHSLHQFMPEIPNGDVLLHAGDFSMSGRPEEVEHFSTFLKSLPHPHKIVIAGNHELTFHRESYPTTFRRNGAHPKQFPEETTKGALSGCTYLEDSGCTVSGGLTVYGSPWQPEFCGWAFNLDRGPDLRRKWATLGGEAKRESGEGENGSADGEIDVLMTHGPPLGFGDRCFRGDRAGCYDLLKRVQQLRPKFHVFGHIHEAYGQFQDSFGNMYVNASIVNETYHRYETHRPIVFDLPCRKGFTNTHTLEPLVIKQEVPARQQRVTHSP